MNFNLHNINPDIKKRITDFLSPWDAISLSKTCRTIHSDLDLRILIDDYSYSRSLKKEHNFRPMDYHEGERERIWFRLFPIVLTNPIHTMKFSFSAKDQGWGNRKGRIFIRQDKNENNYQGDIVAEAPLIAHEEKEMYLEFRPEQGQKYTMCYVIGGGGGHELYIRDPKIQTLFYHNGGVVDAANILRKKDIVPIRDSNFGVTLLIGVVDRLIQDHSVMNDSNQGPKNDSGDSLAYSLASIGIDPHNVQSLRALKKFLEQLHAFRKPRARRKR